jgi:hypothetical protein
MLISILIIIFTQEAYFPKFMLPMGTWLSGILLEVYLLHPYLKVSPTSYSFINLIGSIVGVLLISTMLSWFSDNFFKFFKSHARVEQ